MCLFVYYFKIGDFHVSPKAYYDTKTMYDSYCDAQVWGSFLDYLAFYNCSDVVIATLAFNEYTKSMKNKYKYGISSIIVPYFNSV